MKDRNIKDEESTDSEEWSMIISLHGSQSYIGHAIRE
jgi:hypothetical protein